MATSGVYTFNLTRNQIINGALSKVGALAEGENPTPEATANAVTALEVLIQAFSNEVFPFWKIDWKTETFSAASTSEVTGTDGSTVFSCIRPHTSAASNKPTTGADYSTYWTERGSTGGVWLTATDYTAINVFEPGTNVLSITNAFVRRNEIDYPLIIIPKEQFFNYISDKKQTGWTTHLMFEPLLTPRIWLWPVPDTTTDVLHYLAWLRMQDFDAAGNNADARQPWIKYFIYQLAADLAPDYDLPASKENRLERKAAVLLQLAKRNNAEPESHSFVRPAYGRGGGRGDYGWYGWRRRRR